MLGKEAKSVGMNFPELPVKYNNSRVQNFGNNCDPKWIAALIKELAEKAKVDFVICILQQNAPKGLFGT